MLGTAANTMAASAALTSFGVRGIGRCTLQAADSQQSAVHPPHCLPERPCKSPVTSHSARRPLHSQHVQPLQASTLRSGASRCNRSVQLQPTRLLQHKQPNRAPPRACAAERVAPECSGHPECNAPSQAMHTRPNPSVNATPNSWPRYAALLFSAPRGQLSGARYLERWTSESSTVADPTA